MASRKITATPRAPRDFVCLQQRRPVPNEALTPACIEGEDGRCIHPLHHHAFEKKKS